MKKDRFLGPIDLPAPGQRLVLAVSGGVDSMVLLDVLAGKGDWQLVAAHFDHGIRSDTAADAALVRAAARRYGIGYEQAAGRLGPGTSEAVARRARYHFLRQVAWQYRATLVTAHHQDDVLETICINLIRGTGWRGLASLRSHPATLRPLLTVSKTDLVAYAINHGIDWREDITNGDLRLLRNRIRGGGIPRLSGLQRDRLAGLWADQVRLTSDIADELARLRPHWLSPHGISRYWLVMAGQLAACEVLRAWLQMQGVAVQPHELHRLLLFAATARSGQQCSVAGRLVAASARHLTLVPSPGKMTLRTDPKPDNLVE